MRRPWVGASGAERLCALGAIGRGRRPLNFTVRRHAGTRPTFVASAFVYCVDRVLHAPCRVLLCRRSATVGLGRTGVIRNGCRIGWRTKPLGGYFAGCGWHSMPRFFGRCGNVATPALRLTLMIWGDSFDVLAPNNRSKGRDAR